MQNHGSRIPFSPISVVVTGKLHYRLYFEIDDELGTNQKAFEFLVDEASGIVTWQPAFEAAMGGDLSSSRHLVDCVSALDAIQSSRQSKGAISPLAESQFFKPLCIELTLPGLYSVEFTYGGGGNTSQPMKVSLSVHGESVEVENVDQDAWFALADHQGFRDHVYAAVLAFDRARRQAEQ